MTDPGEKDPLGEASASADADAEWHAEMLERVLALADEISRKVFRPSRTPVDEALGAALISASAHALVLSIPEDQFLVMADAMYAMVRRVGFTTSDEAN